MTKQPRHTEPLAYGPRPTLRGWSHVLAAFVCLLIYVPLMVWIPSTVGRVGAGTFFGGLTGLFVISGLYHRVEWSSRGLGRMRRLDHSFICVLIWCIYVPFCLIALPPAEGHWLLAVATVGALVGIARVLLWPYAPKPISVITYTILPMLAVPSLTHIFAAVGALGTACMVVGNAIVTLGAVVYAYDKPDPIPGVFGPHEIFHLTVIACAVLYGVTVMQLALSVQA